MKLRNAEGLRRNWPSLSAKLSVAVWVVLVGQVLVVSKEGLQM